jgi:alkaline phosphatase D
VRLDPPAGPDYPIYRAVTWGDLATIAVLDGRQYRSDQPDDGEFLPLPGLDDESLPLRTLAATALDPATTLLGDDQEAWLIGTLGAAGTGWNVIAQQVIMHGVNVLPGQDPPLTITDTWDGYSGARQRLLEALVAADVANLVVLTGDFHAASAGDVRTNPFDLTTPVVAAEFMASSISSNFPVEAEGVAAVVLAGNPHIRFFDPRNGYVVCDVTPETFVVTYRSIADGADPESPVETAGSFTVVAGAPGIAA